MDSDLKKVSFLENFVKLWADLALCIKILLIPNT